MTQKIVRHVKQCFLFPKYDFRGNLMGLDWSSPRQGLTQNTQDLKGPNQKHIKEYRFNKLFFRFPYSSETNTVFHVTKQKQDGNSVVSCDKLNFMVRHLYYKLYYLLFFINLLRWANSKAHRVLLFLKDKCGPITLNLYSSKKQFKISEMKGFERSTVTWGSLYYNFGRISRSQEVSLCCVYIMRSGIAIKIELCISCNVEI